MNTLIAGNWKTNLLADGAQALAQAVRDQCNQANVCVIPPALYAAKVAELLATSDVALGLQDISDQGMGATTGDICAQQAVDVGAKYVLVGHSERRVRQFETSELVANKALAAASAGILPIVCVGESLDDREAGRHEQVVGEQLAPVIQALGTAMDCVVAYEPVWAIGTGKTASAEQAQAMHAVIRRMLVDAGKGQTKILYGGSVNAANAAELAACPDVNGALVGGAALTIESFAVIVKAFTEQN